MKLSTAKLIGGATAAVVFVIAGVIYLSKEPDSERDPDTLPDPIDATIGGQYR